MAVHLPRAMFVGFLSFGHYGYLLSFIQHLAAASFALENLHCCGTYEYVVFALTVWLFVRFLLISAAASFILSKPTVLVRQIEQCQRLQNRVSTSLVVVVYSLLQLGLLLLLMLMHMSRCIPICIFNNCQLSRTHREGACVASSCNLHTGTKSAIWVVVTFVCTTTSSFTQHPYVPPPPFPCQSIYLSVWRFLVSSAVWNLHKTLFFFSLYKTHPKALNLHFDRSGQST